MDEIIEAFRSVEKGPTRAFTRSQVDGTTVYSLPNGISIFRWEDGMEYIAGRTYRMDKVSVRVIEVSGGFVVVEKDRKSTAAGTRPRAS